MSAQRRMAWVSLLLLLLLAACRAGASGPTPQPSDTPTPVSTPLATLQPTLEAGTSDNPIQFVIVHPAVDGRTADAASVLQEQLTGATGLSVTVEFVDTDRDAVAALCSSLEGPLALAWLSAPGYSAAQALGCSQLLLLEEDAEGAQSREITLIASEDSEITALSGVSDASFCRLGNTDLNTWQAPSLLMLAAGLNPTDVLTELVDVADLDTLVEQVAAGDCDLGALATSDLERIAESATDTSFVRLPETVALPLGVLVAAPELPLGPREALTEALYDWARTEDGADALTELTNARGLALPTGDSLSDWNDLIAQTGMQFDDFNG